MFGLQFLLLGSLSGCLSLLLVIVRNMMLMKYQEWAWVRWKGWIAIYSVFCVAILIITWNGPISILPYLAVQVGTIMYIIVGSLGGILNEIILIVSILVSIYRYGWKGLGDNKFETKKQRQSENDRNSEA